MSEERVTKMRSWEADNKQYNLFKSICAKEGINLGEKINELITNFNKEHGDGNPTSTMDHFINNPDFLVTPMIFRKPEDVRAYLLKIRNTPEFVKLGEQLESVWVKQYNDVEATNL